MKATEIADTIAELCQVDSSVTHGTLCNRLGDDVRGDIQVSIGENLVVFVGASEAFADAVQLLGTETPARVVLRPIEFLCLLIDGCPIPAKMPPARRPPPQGYKTPHFMSVCFDKASPENEKWLRKCQKKSKEQA